MEAGTAILFEPVSIGPKTLPNRFYQVPHASGFGSARPRAQAAFRAIKAEGGWGGVCVEYAPVSPDSDEIPAIAADIWDDRDARALGLAAEAIHAHGALAGLELYHGGASSPNGGSPTVRLAPSPLTPRVQGGGLAEEADNARRPRRYRPHPAELGAGRPAGPRRRLRHRLRVRGAWLPDDPVPLLVCQPTDRRLRGQPGKPGPVLAGDPGRGAGGGGKRLRDRHQDRRARRLRGPGGGGAARHSCRRHADAGEDGRRPGRPVGRDRRVLARGLGPLPVLPGGARAALGTPDARSHRQAGGRGGPLQQPRP